MCKTIQKRFPQSSNACSTTLPAPPPMTYFPQFFTPQFIQLANFTNQATTQNLRQQPQQYPSLPFPLAQFAPIQGLSCFGLPKPSIAPFSLQPNSIGTTPSNPIHHQMTQQIPSSYRVPSSYSNSEASTGGSSSETDDVSVQQQLPAKKKVKVITSRKRKSDEVSTENGSDSDFSLGKHSKKEKRSPKRKHEATLDGERRVAIEFENCGNVGQLPQTYGKGLLIVPDGCVGKYSAFGQRWKFSINHAVGPVTCEDGVSRMCISWSITNLSSGLTHTVVETAADALKRDRDGKTLCNRVVREALLLRASGLEKELEETSDPNVALDLQTQLKTMQTKRFSEGPLFFGLRHLSLQTELRAAMKKREEEISASPQQLQVENPAPQEIMI